MLVKNLLKRGLSVLICAAMLAVMFTSVTALADNYEIKDSSFTDELENTNFLYSYPNNPNDWNLTQNTDLKENEQPVSGYRVLCGGKINGWSIPSDKIISYKAGGNKKFTKATFTIWINNDSANAGDFPIVKVQADAKSELKTVSNVTWDTLTAASADTSWLRKSECTVCFPEGTVIAGLGFNGNLKDHAFIFDKAEFMIGNKAKKFYDDCNSLDNMWSYKELQVVDDKSGEVNYNNGGKMIGMTKDWYEWEAVYKIPDGRNFKSAFFEISRQNDEGKEPKIAYSADGINYTDFTFSWNKTDTSPSPGSQNNAGWSKIWTADVPVPQDVNNIKFIKLYYGGEGNKLQQYQFYLRKVCIMSEGGEIDSEVVDDDLSGGTAERYSVSNFVPYNLINKDEAGQIANETTFKDKDLLAVKDVKKDAYIIYKASEGRVFTGIDLNQLTRDNGGNIKVQASKDGNTFSDINVTDKDSNFIGDGNKIDAGWNKLFNTTAAFTKQDGYTYIKLIQPANTLSESKCFKLSNVKLTISSAYSLFKKDGETETDLNGKAEKGTLNLIGKINYTPKDGETDFYAIIALKENGIIKNIGLNNITGVTSATKVFETPVLENCDINDNTVVEVYLFNNDSLKPVLSEKGEFSSK